MTTVLAALDADASARPVLRTAIAIAPLFDATATALHVPENGASAAENLARASGVELRTVSGVPIDQIVAATQDPDVAALVLGARGVHGGPQPAGHTALDVITRVPKPIVVVPPHAEPPEELALILVPLEGSSESSRALEDTIRLAQRRRLQILVLHVHSPTTVPAFADHEPHATRAWDQEFLTRHIATPHEHVRLLRRVGVPADDIVAVARETTADLIALAGVRTSVPATRAWCPRRSRTAASPSCSSPCRERRPRLPSRPAVSRSPREVQRLTPIPGSAREG
jgi:nucleotide-binding universal stress UspA family protein